MTTKTFALGLVLLAGCLKANPNYLSPDGNNGSNGSNGSNGGSDGGMGSGCTASSCNGMSPVCESNGSCGPCESDTDCSGATPTCLPSGACDGDANLAYVTATGSDASPCTIEAPCATVMHAMTVKSTVVLTGTANDDGLSLAQGSDVTILGRGSAVIATDSGAVVMISTGDLELYATQLYCKPGGTAGINSSTTGTITLQGDGIGVCPAGIDMTGGTLLANRIEVYSNTGGGISLTSTSFDIENGLIHDNGTGGTGVGASQFGGINITSSPSSTDTIEFTTIANNHATSGVVGGVLCSGQAPTHALTFSSNIIAGNDQLAGTVETSGANCAYTYTDFYPALAKSDGSGNGSGDPMFAGAGDFHISSSSPAKDAADPNASLKIDFYGNARPVGSGYDMGADEFQ